MDGQVISLGYKEVFGKATLPVLLLVYTFAGLKSYGKRAARSMVSTTRYLRGMETRLHGSEDWLALTDSIESFDNSSSLKLNGKKTEGLLVGSVVGNNEKRCPEKNFKWRENKVKFLGARLDLY